MKTQPSEDQQDELLTSFIYVWMTEDGIDGRWDIQYLDLELQRSQLLHHDFYSLNWSESRPPNLKKRMAEQKKGQTRVVSAIMKNIMYRIVGRGMGRGQNERQKEQKQKNNTRDSNVVPHRSTNLARQCLTSLSKREAVLSLWYGRSCRIVTTQTL